MVEAVSPPLGWIETPATPPPLVPVTVPEIVGNEMAKVPAKGGVRDAPNMSEMVAATWRVYVPTRFCAGKLSCTK